MKSNIKLVPLAGEHLKQVQQIEKQAHSHPWSESLIADINSRGAFHHVMIVDEQVVGYFYAQNIVGEVTLLNIAVNPSCQGSGYGKWLLESFIDLCSANRAESIWLEVRQSNNRAINLYNDAGFNEVDRRVDYYPSANGKEDAIIMSYIIF
ncbi:ribosomal protein S18-alanine N-acetyltransferase [Vibrio marisflavi]|uniref:[Ribosomal protein bS18]-alanine N-acetyltransferase n=1 Tax=Vibrio marisflavi CECT 7928 TaxID=634439 RepID=A0ABM9A3V5_9VIBR|nr:ribosomal protein S18-alanine N-acetyltransferase [Vibrio marisflavi]CAH0538788.1 [Ribosomal protein S18]-alanine N-acetyltransferase [Vibrio marisflavi CECT 7928]